MMGCVNPVILIHKTDIRAAIHIAVAVAVAAQIDLPAHAVHFIRIGDLLRYLATSSGLAVGAGDHAEQKLVIITINLQQTCWFEVAIGILLALFRTRNLVRYPITI